MAKIAIGALAGISLLLCGGLVAVSHRPVVNRYIRIDEAGRAQAIQYTDLNYSPREGEIRTYLTDWTGYRHTINRETMAKKYPMNYYFLSSALASQLIGQENANHLITQVTSGQTEQSEVQVNNVTITSMIQEKIENAILSRGTALETFDLIYPMRSSSKPRTEHWMASFTYYLNPAQVSNPDEIDRRVEGTELEAFISKDAPDQRQGVLGSLGLIADSLRLLPTKEQAKGKEWSATAWAEKREGWIFLTGTEAEQEALRPLHSLWIDLLILRLLTLPKEGQNRAWFVLDELATLQKLPQFHSALTKGRKSDNPIIFGYQGKAQLEVIYGHLAEVMLSQPATKFVLKTAEPKAAKWASELIGDIEIERVRETVADGKRAGKSFTMDRQIEPLVMSSEIAGLEDLHAFLKLGNNVTRFSFPHMDRPLIAPSFVARDIPEGDMWLNPLAPAKPTPVTSPVPAAAAQLTTTPPAAEVATASVTAQPVVKEKAPLVTPSPTVVSTQPPANVPVFGPAVLVAATHPSSDL